MNEKMVLEKEFKHARLFHVPQHPHCLVLESSASYIPFESFKEIFNYIGSISAPKGIKKLIFDKRKLTVFHQESMEWYFVEWKEKMFDLGLKTHRKILPNDDVFRQSVRIGREKITKTYPNKKFNQMDIQYAESIEEALEK